MTNGKLRIAIIGAGIGGPAAAAALHRFAEVDVTVYEQARRLGEVGAGIGLAPNGQRGLAHLGLREAIEAASAEFEGTGSYYRSDGTFIDNYASDDSAGEFRVRGIHRADLIDVLAGAIPADIVHTGHRLVGLSQDADGVELRFENGEVATFDAVIGADGIHSVVRESVTEPSEAVYSGSIAYRGVVDASRLPEGWSRNLKLWLGDGKHFMCYPVRRHELYNYVGFVKSDRPLAESWSAVGDVEDLRAEFAGWHPDLQAFLGAIDEVFWWGIRDREPLTTWTNGRLALMGDAAHAMQPHMSQGLNQAIEDGLALAAFLKDIGTADVPAALEGYAAFRMDRANTVQAASRRNGDRYDSQGEYEDLDKRDEEVRTTAELRRWVYDHDALVEATAAAAAARV